MDPLLTPKDFKPLRSVSALGSAKAYREPAGATFARWGRAVSETWKTRPNVRRGAISALAVMLCASAAMAYVSLRTRPVPDVFAADLTDVLDYTLVSDDFNKLPVKERLRLLQDFMRRLRAMDSGDSAAMAAFAAGITGKARAQLQKNAERLAVDLWDDFAKDYTKVDPADKDAYLNQAAIDFTKMMESLAGVERDIDDDKRLKEMQRQAKRDEQQMPGAGRAVDPAAVGAFLGLIDRVGQGNTSPTQRDRMAEFGRDMTRHLRGYEDKREAPKPKADPQDADKKKPRKPGEPDGPATPPTDDPAKDPAKDEKKDPKDPNEKPGHEKPGESPKKP